MGLLDKAKSVAEQATTKAKEGLEDVQTRRELGQAYEELGKATFDLVDNGVVANDRLQPIVERIRSLQTQLQDGSA